MSPDRLVFVDETWASTNMAPRLGRAPRGTRVVAAAPYGHWKTSTFVAALRRGGLAAPFVVDHAMDGATFRAHVERVLAPTPGPGGVVVVDDLGSHKAAGIRQAIEARGAALLHLPPYSPGLNPIEQVFAEFKAMLRRASARSVEALWTAIRDLLGAFTPAECGNYLANCGYRHPC